MKTDFYKGHSQTRTATKGHSTQRRAFSFHPPQKRRFLYILIIVFLAVYPWHFVFAAKLFDKAAKKQFTAYLDEICQWIMTDAGGGISQSDKGGPGAIATQGNAVRVLLVGFELTKNHPTYLDQALQWCDAFVSRQQRVATLKGAEAGYWLDQGSAGDPDLGSAGTAAAALARACVYAEADRKKAFLQALERYARFVMEGCKEDPQGKSRGGSAGWIIQEGDGKGAISSGYHKDRVSIRPSTLATAANADFLARLYAITKNNQYRQAAGGAIRWILKLRKPIGEIPFILEGEELEQRPLETVTACTDAILAAYYLLEDPDLNQLISKEIEPTVRWLVRIQDDRGLWGERPDQQHSSGAATLLAWFYLNVTADEAFPQALEKFWQTMLNPVHSQSFGVQMLAHTTALVGLTTAEMIKPGITYKKI